MALHNLLDMALPTIAIVRGMYDEFHCSARQGINNEGLNVNDQLNASESPAARSLSSLRQLWAAIKSLWLGCPAEVYDVTVKPFAWLLDSAHVLVQVIVWCGALELIVFGSQPSKAISDYTAWTVNSYAVSACYFGVLAVLHGSRGLSLCQSFPVLFFRTAAHVPMLRLLGRHLYECVVSERHDQLVLAKLSSEACNAAMRFDQWYDTGIVCMPMNVGSQWLAGWRKLL